MASTNSKGKKGTFGGVVKAKKTARMLAINPGARGVASTGADVDRTRRALAANKGKGIRFDDQKVDTSNVKDLRPPVVKKARKAPPKPLPKQSKGNAGGGRSTTRKK